MSSNARPGLGLLGSSGRMGGEILRLAEAQDRSVLPIGRDWTMVKPAQISVVIDFSLPEGLRSAVAWCLQQGKPLVSGTTGLDVGLKADLEAAARKIPVLWSANMSIGVHVLARAIESLSPLQGWEFQISETHHRHKKDKPSGTALFLQTQLQKALGTVRLPEPESRREGEVIGDHVISAKSSEEVLTFEHRALSRAVFARGALLAADWLAKKGRKPGLYTMADVLFANEEG